MRIPTLPTQQPEIPDDPRNKGIFFPITFCLSLFALAGITLVLLSPEIREARDPQPWQHYTYRAHVSSVHDGDTITCDIILGLGVVIKDRHIRLAGINAPELRHTVDGRTQPNQEGILARNHLTSLVNGQDILLITRQDKSDKYGRLLGVPYYWDGDHYIDACQAMVDTGHAKPYMLQPIGTDDNQGDIDAEEQE